MKDDHLKRASQALTLLERREIEAGIAGPLVLAMIERFGDGPVREVLAEVISGLARKSGRELAANLGDTSLESFASTIELWKGGGALEIEMLEQSADALNFNVTRCQYAEMYRRLGLAELGATISCLRDYELAAGFNTQIKLKRTQTIMEGAEYCDFRFRRVKS